MKTLAMIVTLLATAPQAVAPTQAPVPEGAIIASADVTGFEIGRLSPGLRQEIRSLAGTPFGQDRLNALAARIEAERPGYVAAARAFTDPTGQVRVVFIVGRSTDRDREENVNARYVVEHVDITGVPERELTPALRDDVQALVGKRLDSEAADRLEARMEGELPRYDVRRRILRGSERGRIRLVYEARKREPPPWLRFEPPRSNVVYHSDQGWGSYLDVGIGGRDIRFTPIVAIDTGDDLIEDYSGFGLRFETRRMGTRRLGASLEWTSFGQDWRDATLDALALDPAIPPPYESRATLTPLVRFAVSPEIGVTAGVSISELDALPPASGSTMANAAVASIDYLRSWETASGAQEVHGSFGVRAGSRALESDLVYTRYLGRGWYRYGRGKHRVRVTAAAGGITGDAPLFERFALGDSTTLRGWDKFDITPAGGDRMFHTSVEYGYRGLGVFVDLGSVWEEASDRRVRLSTGLSFRAGPAFAAVGFPLNTDDLRAVFTMGLRAGIGFQR